MGTKERRAREREEIRTVILDAAREMFATEGYEAVTMRRIAEKIEYSPTAIYFHFRDKDTLMKELCVADFLTLAHQLTKIAQIKDPFEQLRRTGLAYVDFGMQNPNHYRLMFMTPHPPIEFDGEDAARKGNPEEDAYAFLKGIIAGGIAQGRFRGDLKDVELIAQTVWAGVHGVISLQIAKCNDDWVDWKPLKKRATFMVETLIDGLKRV
jgi:AcrR family transcriptional regulator